MLAMQLGVNGRACHDHVFLRVCEQQEKNAKNTKSTKRTCSCAAVGWLAWLRAGMAACVPVSRLPRRPLCRAVLAVMLLPAGCASCLRVCACCC